MVEINNSSEVGKLLGSAIKNASDYKEDFVESEQTADISLVGINTINVSGSYFVYNKTISSSTITSTTNITNYSQSTSNNFGNFNWNAPNDNYAFEFIASTTGVPSVLTLYQQSSGGIYNVYIKNTKTVAAGNYGYATAISGAAGANTIILTSPSTLTTGSTYYIFISRTSATSSSPSFNYDTTKTNYRTYRSAASNSDPNTLWFTYDMKMTLAGTLTSSGNYYPFVIDHPVYGNINSSTLYIDGDFRSSSLVSSGFL